MQDFRRGTDDYQAKQRIPGRTRPKRLIFDTFHGHTVRKQEFSNNRFGSQPKRDIFSTQDALGQIPTGTGIQSARRGA